MAIRVLTADITTLAVDAVVNAARSSLRGGGGVDGAIHLAGGPAILDACERIIEERYPDGLPTGEAVPTTGGRLPARWVIHTVGPIHGHHGGREDELLAACYRNSLMVAARLGCESIAFPAISTGAYGFPGERAAPIVARVLEDWLAAGRGPRDIVLAFFAAADEALFRAHCGIDLD